MSTSLNDKCPLKNGKSLSGGVRLARTEPLASALRLLSTSVPIDVSNCLRLKCDTADGASLYGRAEPTQEDNFFHQHHHQHHQHLETSKTETATTTLAAVETTAAAAAILSSRLHCISTSRCLTSEPGQGRTNRPRPRIEPASVIKHAHHHHHQQQQPTNLVNSISVAAPRRPAVFSAGPNCRHKLSSRHSTPSSAPVIISSISVLIMLLLCSISESQCNSVPSGFLDSGHAIPCKTGEAVSISDYIPFIDSNLSRCYSCTCPNGSVQCGRVEDSPDCMLPPATKLGASGGLGAASAPNEPAATFVGRPASFNKYKPASRAQSAGQSRGHSHPHSQPAWAKPASQINNGKAKTIGGGLTQQQQQQQIRKQVKSSAVASGGGPSTPIAQPIGGPKQPHQNKAPLSDHFRQLSAGTAASGSSSGRFNHQWSAAPLVRHHQHRNQQQQDQVEEADEEESADGSDEDTGVALNSDTGKSANARVPNGSKRHFVRPTVRPYWDDLLASPSLPLNDPKHHSLAAAALGFSQADDYLRMRHKHLQVIADRTSTTPQRLVTTTLSPTTTTTMVVDEEDSSPDAGSDDTDELTSSTGDNNTDQNGDQELDLTTTTATATTTTTTLVPQTISTTDQQQAGQTTVTDESGEPSVPFNELPESPFKFDPTINQEQATTEATTTTTQPPPPQPQPPVFGTDGNAIDHSASNEIMEQVSQDGMLYIAIGVEAFILVSIFAMMVVFYLYREKTTDDDDDIGHNTDYSRSAGQNHLQLPSRSPSIIEKAVP